MVANYYFLDKYGMFPRSLRFQRLGNTCFQVESPPEKKNPKPKQKHGGGGRRGWSREYVLRISSVS